MGGFGMMKKLGWGVILLLMTLTACYEPKEGCLDVRATNFRLDTDRACADCCTYPNLKIRFNHRWVSPDTTLPLRLDTFYIDGAGNPFRIQRIRYYWSDIQLTRANGATTGVTDSVLVVVSPRAGDSISTYVVNSFLLADAGPNNQTLTVGPIQLDGLYNGLQATFGIPEPANRAVPVSLPSDHPLAPQPGRMNLGSQLGYAFAKVEFFRDTVAADTVPVVVHLYGENARRTIDLPFFTQLSLPQGFNPLITLEADYQQWFSGTNVRGDTSTLKSRLLDNLPTAFRVISVAVE